ncbi:CYTH domain-containing protein [Fervidibacillus halotolerans]|uniref:CYTH domain-containing protein n=1 Tax=Fervidibacillus halotolerans TaxID=2980027 RepID=A0A9E8M2C2_9BACI|nr:CYTH domain-containing protein [Fervidibacillus halotolerans]WAA13074.1 CYTH domain-containing protein [Fervidibacillus halotolerans]
MQQLEIEFKNLLTEHEFNQLKDYFSIREEEFFCQENYYFDTPNFLLKTNGMALRIRKKMNVYELTLKEQRDVGLLETTEPLSLSDAKSFINGQMYFHGDIKNRLEQLQIPLDTIRCFGQLKTFRAERPYRDGLFILDKSMYLKKTDYELEYEVKDAEVGEQSFIDLLRQFQIPRRKTENKIARLYNEKMRQASRKNREAMYE